MAAFLSVGLNSVVSPFPYRTRPLVFPALFDRANFGGTVSIPHHRPLSRGTLGIARFGLGQVPNPLPDDALEFIQELYGRAEAIVYTVADAAVSGSSSDAVTTTTPTTVAQNSDWLSGITNSMEAVLKVLKDGLSSLHVPYAYGFAIILLTVLVKAATFPLTKKQVESAMAMRSLQPQIKAIQQRYAGNQERIQLETARLYKLAGINPLAGCLPTLATIPVWIGLYRALSNVANEGLLTEGFFWIPSLAGPTTIASRQNGSGISWLFPFMDGHPPLGWSDTLAYLVLPVLLVITQYISVQIMQSSQNNDPNVKSSQALTNFLPLMIGYFALSVPSGLSLYWFTNNVLSTFQQIWLQKLGGARNPAKMFTDDIMKGDQTEIQKPTLEATVTNMKKEEKMTSEGLRPGERFKQIKEEEARRRRQQEEEKTKAEEVSARGIDITDDERGNEASAVGTANGARSDTDSNNERSNGEHPVNGDGSYAASKEDQNTSIKWKEEGGTSANSDNAWNNLHHTEKLKQEEAVATASAKDGTCNSEDIAENRSKL